jgi:hypothetical protein
MAHCPSTNRQIHTLHPIDTVSRIEDEEATPGHATYAGEEGRQTAWIAPHEDNTATRSRRAGLKV